MSRQAYWALGKQGNNITHIIHKLTKKTYTIGFNPEILVMMNLLDSDSDYRLFLDEENPITHFDSFVDMYKMSAEDISLYVPETRNYVSINENIFHGGIKRRTDRDTISRTNGYVRYRWGMRDLHLLRKMEFIIDSLESGNIHYGPVSIVLYNREHGFVHNIMTTDESLKYHPDCFVSAAYNMNNILRGTGVDAIIMGDYLSAQTM